MALLPTLLVATAACTGSHDSVTGPLRWLGA